MLSDRFQDALGLGEELFSARQLSVVRTRMPEGLRFTGEIDASNVREVVGALASCHGAGSRLHLDLSELLFCDVSGIRAIMAYAESLDSPGKLVLHGLPLQIEKVINVVGWGELPGLEFCNCGMGE